MDRIIIKVGKCILLDGVPYKVVKALQGGRGRGASFTKSTIKNLITGRSSDKTFNSEDQIEIPDLLQARVEYSWEDTSTGECVFMDTRSFEEIRVLKSSIEKAAFLVPGQEVTILQFNGNPIDVTLPHTGQYTVVSIDVGSKMYKFFLIYSFSYVYPVICRKGGNAATLDSGAIIGVPENMKEGQRVTVNIEDELYLGRS